MGAKSFDHVTVSQPAIIILTANKYGLTSVGTLSRTRVL